ncbi:MULTISPECIES: hypothetical protein [Acetobacter]|uniref:Uncharacterized protein n=2 Tax=Acetobacter TaxID=434 RepID=A0AAN1PIL4_9PROT|nr:MULTISPECIES: hypothetical protein [Acetobacter]ASL39735.1 hypothetical protein CBI36_04265 [Acetobacter oryzifermentans]AXN00837.1 hypothetical protein CJF59_09950 [Acetobacter pomorum]KAA8395793.1 hypothetical protein FKW22_07615 [Acetobacter sp. DmW_125124]KAA8396625.1 hypothetical protein FKW19_08015 [Acetobacter sp. DmW_125128]KAA8398217.1 hypothetical protein FKW20_07620 [Acetobacter sp. DmW_125127]
MTGTAGAGMFLAALAFVWPFLGAAAVCAVSVARSRELAIWMSAIGCVLALAVFVFPASGAVAAGWDDDPVQRAGRVMLAFGLLLIVLENGILHDRLVRSLPHVSTALAGLACVAPDPAVGLGILEAALAWGVFVFTRPAGQARMGWGLIRNGSVGTFLVLSGLLLPANTVVSGLMMACGLVVLTGLSPFGQFWQDENDTFLFLPFAGAALLLAMRLRTHGGEAFETALVLCGLLSVWLTACAGRFPDRQRLFRTFPSALALIAVGIQADVAALLFLCGWCLAGGGRAGRGWAVNTLACFPPGAPFVGCLLLLSMMSDWSWPLALLTVAGILAAVTRAVPARDITHHFWPQDAAGRVACSVLTATGLLVPLAMMLGAF